MHENRQGKYTWLIIILAIIALTLIGFIVRGKFVKSGNTAKTETVATDTNNVTTKTDDTAATPAKTMTPATTTVPAAPVVSEADNIAAVNKVVNSFLTAWKQRSLDDAKPFMTTAYFNSTDQSSFAGVSSPSRGRTEITSTKAVTAGQKYTVIVRSYQNLQGAEIGYSDNTLDVVKAGSGFLVNSLTEGKFIQN